MSKVTWEQIRKVQKDYDNRTESLFYGWRDLIKKFGTCNINDFPKEFEEKEELSDKLNTCNKCGDIQNTETEMYWQGEGRDVWHDCLDWEFNKEDTYTAVCDDCFEKLYKKTRNMKGYQAHWNDHELQPLLKETT